MTNGIKVKKRNGRGVEPLNLEKIHVMVEEACKNLAGVSASQVEIQSGIQFYDGISTEEIQEILIKSASDLLIWIILIINMWLQDFYYLLSERNCTEG